MYLIIVAQLRLNISRLCWAEVACLGHESSVSSTKRTTVHVLVSGRVTYFPIYGQHIYILYEI